MQQASHQRQWQLREEAAKQQWLQVRERRTRQQREPR
jgi:hypothetical protein